MRLLLLLPAVAIAMVDCYFFLLDFRLLLRSRRHTATALAVAITMLLLAAMPMVLSMPVLLLQAVVVAIFVAAS